MLFCVLVLGFLLRSKSQSLSRLAASVASRPGFFLGSLQTARGAENFGRALKNVSGRILTDRNSAPMCKNIDYADFGQYAVCVNNSGGPHVPVIVSRCGGPSPRILNACGLCGEQIAPIGNLQTNPIWEAIDEGTADTIRMTDRKETAHQP